MSAAVTVAIPTLNAGPGFAETLAAVRAQRVDRRRSAPHLRLGLLGRDAPDRPVPRGRCDPDPPGELLARRHAQPPDGRGRVAITSPSSPRTPSRRRRIGLRSSWQASPWRSDVGLVFGPYRPRPGASVSVARELTSWFASFSSDGPRVDRAGPRGARCPGAPLPRPPGLLHGRQRLRGAGGMARGAVQGDRVRGGSPPGPGHAAGRLRQGLHARRRRGALPRVLARAVAAAQLRRGPCGARGVWLDPGRPRADAKPARRGHGRLALGARTRRTSRGAARSAGSRRRARCTTAHGRPGGSWAVVRIGCPRRWWPVSRSSAGSELRYPSATLSSMPTPAVGGERLPVVVARSVSKTFTVPEEQVHTLKERALHPRRRIRRNSYKALDNVSVAVQPGEFFGIAGRNGSGKSTLLKCMAGIYKAEGDIWVPWSPVDVHRAGRRVQPGPRRARQRRHERDHARPHPTRGAQALRERDRVRRASGVQGAQAQELLLGDARPPGVQRGNPGRCRHPHDRRGPGGR